MKQQILQIIHDYPRHYTRKIKQNQNIINLLNKKYADYSLVEQLYCFVNDHTLTKCKYGNLPKFNTINKGYWKFCKFNCQCSKEQQSKAVINWKNRNPELEEIRRNKANNTMIARYGCENPMDNYALKSKQQETNLRKYGTETPFESKYIQNKVKQTNIDRYGVEYPLQSKEIQEKVHTTLKDRYGDNYMQVPLAAAYKKYGMNPFADKSIQQQISKTLVQRYGVKHPKQIHINNANYTILESEKEFKKTVTGKTRYEAALLLGVTEGVIARRAKTYGCLNLLMSGYSNTQVEIQIENIIKDIGIKYDKNNRKIIKPKEIDFFFPTLNIGLEIGSLFWHSELSSGRSRKYHYNKWKQCDDLNIILLQYFDNELNNTANVIASKLKYLNNAIDTKIGARKVQLTTITSNADERIFLNQNHIQGFASDRSYAVYGYYDGKLISVMTFAKRQSYIELTRFATDLNIVSSGLFSKMLKYAMRNFEFTAIVSFSDNRHGNGNVYLKSGFKHIGNVAPSYQYTKDYHSVQSRRLFQKKNLQKLVDFDVNDYTEWEIVQKLGYDRIWDAGKKKWMLT